jgi:hypothetical protein
VSSPTDKQQKLITYGVILWVSFLWAGIATILFFATFDPAELAMIATFPMELTRSSGYSAGFLLFWVLLIANSAVIDWLSKRKP